MFLRKSFHEFLVLHSEAEPLPCGAASPVRPLPPQTPQEAGRTGTLPGWQIDWRWLEAPEDVP